MRDFSRRLRNNVKYGFTGRWCMLIVVRTRMDHLFLIEKENMYISFYLLNFEYPLIMTEIVLLPPQWVHKRARRHLGSPGRKTCWNIFPAHRIFFFFLGCLEISASASRHQHWHWCWHRHRHCKKFILSCKVFIFAFRSFIWRKHPWWSTFQVHLLTFLGVWGDV